MYLCKKCWASRRPPMASRVHFVPHRSVLSFPVFARSVIRSTANTRRLCSENCIAAACLCVTVCCVAFRPAGCVLRFRTSLGSFSDTDDPHWPNVLPPFHSGDSKSADASRPLLAGPSPSRAATRVRPRTYTHLPGPGALHSLPSPPFHPLSHSPGPRSGSRCLRRPVPVP